MALSLATTEQLLSYAAPISALVLLFRLAGEGLLNRYRCLAAYLGCLIAEVAVLLVRVPRHTSRYLYTYIAVESILWLVQVFVVVELMSLVVHDYPGIARSGRRFLWLAVAVAVAVAAAVAFQDPGSGLARFPILEHYLLIARVLAVILLLFLVLTLTFLFWFPIPLSRNILSYAVGFTVYFTCRALTRLVGTVLLPEQLVFLSIISLSIVVGCLVFWIFSLTRAGESVDFKLGLRWTPEHSDALVRRLESINAALLGRARR